ncbi:MAG: tyrosine-type recombinase/integrase [Faecousia sp.]
MQGGNGRPVIYEDFNFHSLRNTFASRRRADGIPEHVISAMLGHKNETTTEKYMRIDYAQFDNATRSYRGMNTQAVAPGTPISDNASLEDYLKSLDRDGLKAAMDAVYAHLMAAT